jgi:RNA polymerase II-associated protein 2
MAAARPPKGILKMPDASADASQRAPQQHHRDIAVQHATILQQRKDLEAQILDDVILLSEYPVSPDTTAAQPAPADVAAFKARVRLFQPSDYDDLVTERNVNGMCGYTLCRRPHRETGPGGEWTLAASGQIVRRKEVEKWCSQACARRALYVKVQLNETAAWERAGIPDIEIELLDEDRSDETEADRTARKLGELKLEDQRQAARDSEALARERGEKSTTPGVKIKLKEKKHTAPPEADRNGVFNDGEEDHMVVEGYKTKRGTTSGAGS